jgi:riboflavin kinase/FMN adenylyltransferase
MPGRDGELYGQHLEVELLRHLRDEARFPDLEALTARMEQDVQDIRAWLRETAGRDRNNRTG